MDAGRMRKPEAGMMRKVEVSRMEKMEMNRMKMVWKMIAVLCLIAGLMLGTTQPALAAKAVTYIDENGLRHAVTNYRKLDSRFTTFGGGTWVTTETIDGAGELSLTADTVLILDGSFSVTRSTCAVTV